MEKDILRQKAREIRRGLELDALSRAICRQIAQMQNFRSANNVLLFHPTECELNLLQLCEFDKNFYLPRVEGKKLLICPYDCNIKLEKSLFNLLEPCSAPVSPQVIDFAIIPCLMADRRKYRLGYGGGFYDRFLPELRSDCVKISAVASMLVIEKLPTNEFDLPVDYIVSEAGVF